MGLGRIPVTLGQLTGSRGEWARDPHPNIAWVMLNPRATCHSTTHLKVLSQATSNISDSQSFSPDKPKSQDLISWTQGFNLEHSVQRGLLEVPRPGLPPYLPTRALYPLREPGPEGTVPAPSAPPASSSPGPWQDGTQRKGPADRGPWGPEAENAGSRACSAGSRAGVGRCFCKRPCGLCRNRSSLPSLVRAASVTV